MKTIPFLILGTNFHFDDKTGSIVRPLFNSSFQTEFSFDESDPDRTDKLIDFYATECCLYDNTVVINLLDGHISAYKKVKLDNSIFVRDRMGCFLFLDREAFQRFDFDPTQCDDEAPIREE